jgi:hypothetical protein
MAPLLGLVVHGDLVCVFFSRVPLCEFSVKKKKKKMLRLPWRGQSGRAAAGCARAAASGWRARCQYYAKFYTASYLTH